MSGGTGRSRLGRGWGLWWVSCGWVVWLDGRCTAVAAEGVGALGRKGCGGHGIVEVNWDEGALKMLVGDLTMWGVR